MSQEKTPRLAPGTPRYEQAKEEVHKLFARLLEELESDPRTPDCRYPSEVTMGERMAVNILVKHYHWRVIEPGTLHRAKTGWRNP